MRSRAAVAAVLVGAGLIAVGSASPASAHAVGGDGASNFHTVLTGVGPDAPPGLTVRIVENGNRLELENRTGRTVYVLGYGEEPYLRITPTEVDENRRSTAAYLNSDRFASVPVPAGVDNTGEDWQHLADGPVVRWHDHRIHWMSTALPPAVAAAPDVVQQVYPWQVLLRVDGRELTVSGRLDWIPGPSAAPWWGLTAGLFVVALAVGLGTGRRARSRGHRLGVAALLAVVTVADVGHSVGIAADRAGTSVVQALWAYPAVDLGWVAAAVAAGLLLAGRSRPGLVIAAGWGAWTSLTGGLAQLNVFHHSSAPFLWAITTARALTAVELGVGAAVVLVAVSSLRGCSREGSTVPAPAATTGTGGPIR